MLEREAPAVVLGHDRERRAVYPGGIDPEPACEAAHQAGLARAELSDEPDQLAAPGRTSERLPERLGLLAAGGRDLTHPHGIRAPAAPRAAPPSGAERGWEGSRRGGRPRGGRPRHAAPPPRRRPRRARRPRGPPPRRGRDPE